MRLVMEQTSATTRKGLSPMFTTDGRRLLYRQRHWDYTTNKWSQTWNNHILQLDDPSSTTEQFMPMTPEAATIQLCMGGSIHIQCNAISVKQSEQVKEEMLNTVVMRRYQVNNKFEPRVHSLYHANATEGGVDNNKSPQPAYSYASAHMKAYPLSSIPQIQTLYHQVAEICRFYDGVDCGEFFDHLTAEEIANYFNIGVDPLIYRDGLDKIGLHADNDQDEKRIATLVIDCPAAGPRMIRVEPNKTIMKALRQGQQWIQGEHQPPLEQIEMFIGTRDLYIMDGDMQVNYLHGVPENKKQTGLGNQRLTLVFRRGREVYRSDDSGVVINDLSPEEKIAPYRHGPMLKDRDYPPTPAPRRTEDITRMRLDDPRETNLIQYGDIVRRNVMLDWYGHCSEQGGISGNKLFGCDSIVISQPRRPGERVQVFPYYATSKQKALSLVASFDKQHAVRTWRSSDHDPDILLDVEESGRHKWYQYYGLAEIINYRCPREGSDDKRFCFLLVMMNWDGKNNNDPPTMAEYNRVKSLRVTPTEHEELDEVNDLSKLLAEVMKNPSVRSYRISEPNDSSEEGNDEEDDDSSNYENDFAHDDDSVLDEAKQEEDIVLQQDPLIQDADVPSDEVESTTAATTEASSLMSSSEQQALSSSSSRSRKRRGERSSIGPTKTKTNHPPHKWSAKEKMKLLKEVIAITEKKFMKERDSSMSKLPRSFGDAIGDIGIIKSGNKNYVVLVCHPFEVPPTPVRDNWLEKCFKGKKTTHVIVFWYGQTNPKRMYGYEKLSSIKPYSEGEKGLKLNKTGMEQLLEDWQKKPAERRRGVVDFLEGYQMLGIDDVDETLEECGEY